MIRTVLFALIALFSINTPAFAAPTFHVGDIIFQTSKSSQSLAVQSATKSPYSHMGLILIEKRTACVFEAVSTVKCTPIKDWIARGIGGHYVLKRLKSTKFLDSSENQKKLIEVAHTFSNRLYDLTFEWSDDRMYCSELVWKVFDRAFGIKIGSLSKLGDFDLSSPTVKKKIDERYHGKPPWNEIVISPKAIFDSPLLVEITRK